jgi:iron complex transport system ATP-binding protein
MMAGLIPPDQGKVLCNVRRSYLAQSLQNREDLPLTVDDYLHLGPELLKCHSSEDLTKQLYQYFDVQDLKLRFLDELSGGQFQRIQLMKALFVQPELLLLDEPLNSLDEKFQVLTMDYLKTWKQQGKSVVAVLHDEDLAKKYCDRLFILHCEHLIPWDQRGAHGC